MQSFRNQSWAAVAAVALAACSAHNRNAAIEGSETESAIGSGMFQNGGGGDIGITVTPSSANIGRGKTTQFGATGGRSSFYIWTIESGSEVGTISPTGLFTASLTTPGTAVILCQDLERRNYARVSVNVRNAGDPDPTWGNRLFEVSSEYADGAIDAIIQKNAGGNLEFALPVGSSDYSPDQFAVARVLPSGVRDTTFGEAITNGQPTVLIEAYNGATGLRPATVTPLSSGKIILAGACQDSNETPGVCTVRINPDGSLDASFGVGGSGQHFTSLLRDVRATTIQPDGKILHAGQATVTLNGANHNVGAVVRIKSNGTNVDSGLGGFGDCGKYNAIKTITRTTTTTRTETVTKTYTSTDTGTMTGFDDPTPPADPKFYPHCDDENTRIGRATLAFLKGGSIATSIAVGIVYNTSSNKIYILESVGAESGKLYPNGVHIARLTNQGGLDTNYDTGFGNPVEISPDNWIRAGYVEKNFGGGYIVAPKQLIARSGGKMLAGVTAISDSASFVGLIEFNTDGTDSTNFGTQTEGNIAMQGRGLYRAIANAKDSFNTLAIQTDGKILVSAKSDLAVTNAKNQVVYRLGANGAGFDGRAVNTVSPWGLDGWTVIPTDASGVAEIYRIQMVPNQSGGASQALVIGKDAGAMYMIRLMP